MGYYAAIAGALLQAGGTWLQGNANDIARRRVEHAANLEGVDTSKLTGQALTDEEKYLAQATRVSAGVSAANQAQLTAQEETALPGAGAARGTALTDILKLFSDDKEWLQGVERRGAAMGLTMGTGGTQAGQIGTLRLSDREKMDRTKFGTGLLGSLLGTLRLANSPGVQTFLPPDAARLIDIRSQERAAQQQLLAKAGGMPGATAAWAQYFKEQGAMLEGAGMGSMGGGGAGAGAGAGMTGTGGGGGGVAMDAAGMGIG